MICDYLFDNRIKHTHAVYGSQLKINGNVFQRFSDYQEASSPLLLLEKSTLSRLSFFL